MRITKPLIIECSNCNEIIEIDTDLEAVSSDERSMGYEIEYEGIIEDSCPNCGNPLYIKISVWEYPEGVLNYNETTIDGANILEEPHFTPFD